MGNLGMQLFPVSGLGTFTSSGNDVDGSGFATPNRYDFDIVLNPGQSITVGGDWGRTSNTEDIYISGGGYNFVGASPFGIGTFQWTDQQAGTWTYTIDRATLDANGGNQTILFSFNNNLNTDQDDVYFNITCFGEGTRIATPYGETAVEALKIGDPILTANGREVAVKWVGRQTVSTLFTNTDRLRLVRITAGALGDGLPLRDLRVTADHALFLDGLLANAGALVNGTSIRYEPLGALGTAYTIYHVETENHEIIVAEGAATETYIDYVARSTFDNHTEYLALYGEEAVIPEMPHPRISSPRQLTPALRRRLGQPNRAA